ncbi:MAG TPA: LptA/OstA family protein [Vicinamibacterales bacterium]|nr:LptA/OstA family protein [Vicinamibacterales bacterium]
MKWQRPMRVLLAVVGIGFAVALFVLREPAPESSAPAPGLVTDPAASAESSGGRLVHMREGVVRFTIDHQGQRSYPDGRAAFLSAHVVFPESGRQVRADTIETRGQLGDQSAPVELLLRGNVSLVQGDDLDVRTAEATYDDGAGLLNVPGAVEFRKGGLSGAGVGATYDRGADLFRILSDARATLGGDDGKAPGMTLTAGRMSLASTQNHLELDGDAQIVRPGETLAGDRATMTFGADLTDLRSLELRGHASVTPTDDASTVPAMTATDITLGFHAVEGTLEHATLTGSAAIRFREPAGERSVRASWLDLHLAPDGQTVTRLDGRDGVVVMLPAKAGTPGREIRSALLTTRGVAGGGLQSARFEREVVFIERRAAVGQQAAEERSGRSDEMTLTLDGGFDAITDARFLRNVTFVSGSMAAEAGAARYQARESRLVLERPPGASAGRPRVRRADGTFTVDADLIDLSIDTDDLLASGNVSSSMRGGTGKARRSAMFEADQPVYGAGDRLDYEAAGGVATYSGSADRPARLTQGENRVLGVTVVLEESTNNLRATTAVESTFLETPADASAAPRRSEITATSLVYDDAAGLATYTGSVVYKDAQSETESETLVLSLDEHRAVKAFEATGPLVFAKLVGGHEARGERLSYDGQTRLYTLSGKPAQARSPNEAGGDCLLTIGPEVSLAPGRTARWQPVSGVVESRKVSCEGSIR